MTAITRFKTWEQILRQRGALDEADRLAEAVVDVREADADACWDVIWNKPLYANTRVANGERMIDALRPQMSGAWASWGDPTGPVVITHDGAGSRRSNFSIAGTASDAIDNIGIARHRLYAIQGAARALRAMVGPKRDAPLARWHNRPHADLIPAAKQSFGRGWGHITILHMLTDFGLAVKPDLHLARTVRVLGLVPGLPEARVPSFVDAIRINEAVHQFGVDIHGEAFGPDRLRYIDKVLMEVSRQGLLDLRNEEKVA